jgi:hypothetical protein
VLIQPALNDFIAICRELNVHVDLSTWFREDRGGHQHHIPTPRAHANIWIKTLQSIDISFLDLLEPHVWMTTPSDCYARLPYTFDRFSNREHENVVRHAEPLYRADPQHWQSVLRSGIDTIAEWSRQSGKPLVITECWAIVDYKDWPLLRWGWVKELCAIGTQHATRTGR